MTEEKPKFIHPDDPKPVSARDIRARKVAIREGTVVAPPRDEFVKAEAEVVEATEPPAAVVEGEADTGDETSDDAIDDLL